MNKTAWSPQRIQQVIEDYNNLMNLMQKSGYTDQFFHDQVDVELVFGNYRLSVAQHSGDSLGATIHFYKDPEDYEDDDCEPIALSVEEFSEGIDDNDIDLLFMHNKIGV